MSTKLERRLARERERERQWMRWELYAIEQDVGPAAYYQEIAPAADHFEFEYTPWCRGGSPSARSRFMSEGPPAGLSEFWARRHEPRPDKRPFSFCSIYTSAPKHARNRRRISCIPSTLRRL